MSRSWTGTHTPSKHSRFGRLGFFIEQWHLLPTMAMAIWVRRRRKCNHQGRIKQHSLTTLQALRMRREWRCWRTSSSLMSEQLTSSLRFLGHGSVWLTGGFLAHMTLWFCWFMSVHFHDYDDICDGDYMIMAMIVLIVLLRMMVMRWIISAPPAMPGPVHQAQQAAWLPSLGGAVHAALVGHSWCQGEMCWRLWTSIWQWWTQCRSSWQSHKVPQSSREISEDLPVDSVWWVSWYL